MMPGPSAMCAAPRHRPVRTLSAKRGIALALAGVLTGSAGAIEVCFTAPQYVTVPGVPVEIAVKIAYEAGETPDLFSFGVRIVPDGGGANVSVQSVTVVPELDFSGFQSGALVDLGERGAKGNISLGGTELTGYEGTMLARFAVTADAPGDVALALAFFRTAGPNEDVFVTTDGTNLDSQVSFGITTLRVLSPPVVTIEPVAGRDAVRVAFPTAAGLEYELQASADGTGWDPLAAVSGGTFPSVSFEVPVAGGPGGMFRVQAAPDGS